MDVALGLDLRQRGPQSSPELPQSSPRCPPELPELPQKSLATAGCQACAPCYRWLSPRAPQSSPRAPLLPLAARHVLPATAGCPPELPRAPLLPLAARHVLPATAGCGAHLEELPCYRWLRGTCSLLPLAVKHTLKAPPSQRRPGGTHSRVRACRGGPERPKIYLEQRPGGIQKCCTVCAGRSFSRLGFEKWKTRCLKVLYCVHRTLIFVRTLREMETSPRSASTELTKTNRSV